MLGSERPLAWLIILKQSHRLKVCLKTLGIVDCGRMSILSQARSRMDLLHFVTRLPGDGSHSNRVFQKNKEIRAPVMPTTTVQRKVKILLENNRPYETLKSQFEASTIGERICGIRCPHT